MKTVATKKIKTHSYISVIAEDVDGNFNVSFPDFPGCFTCGSTFEDARKNAEEALSLWIDELKASKKKISYFTKNASLVSLSI